MKNKIFIILLLPFLSGCSLLYSHDDTLPQRINQWVLNGKYKTALNAIAYIEPNHKYYNALQQQKREILQYLINYESDAIIKSNQLARQGRWLVAFEFIDNVSENIPNNKKIISHRAILLQQRGKEIKSYEAEILNYQAKSLSEKMKLYDDIKKTVTPYEKNNLNITEFDKSRNETILKLTDQSEHQYNESRYNKAKSSADLALKLRPNKDLVIRLNKIQHRVKKELDIKTIYFVSSAKSLLSKLSQGYSHAILIKTKETIFRLKDNKEIKNNYKTLIAKLEKHLQTGTNRYFKAARKLYSMGKIQEALSIWLRLKELDPEYPKLMSHIKRAEKILQKLNKITKQS